MMMMMRDGTGQDGGVIVIVCPSFPFFLSESTILEYYCSSQPHTNVGWQQHEVVKRSYLSV